MCISTYKFEGMIAHKTRKSLQKLSAYTYIHTAVESITIKIPLNGLIVPALFSIVIAYYNSIDALIVPRLLGII
jgi:hypothetical protein